MSPMTAPRTPDPFFIIGTGRCGTTLLQRMLMGHPHIDIPPETHFFSRFDPFTVIDTDPIPDAAVDTYLHRCTTHPWFAELGLPADDLRHTLATGTRSARELFLWYAGAFLPAMPPHLGEKTPHHEKYVDRILTLFPDARFIHIVRDPRDVVVSLRKEHWMGDQSLHRIAHHVAKIWKRQRAVARRLGPDRYRTLRYEDLVANPEATLRGLCDFLAEPFDPAMLAHHEHAAPGFLPSESSWKNLALQPIDPSRVGRYREHLKPSEIGMVERSLGRLLIHYGYRPDPRAAHAPVSYLAEAIERLWWSIRRTGASLTRRARGASSAAREP